MIAMIRVSAMAEASAFMVLLSLGHSCFDKNLLFVSGSIGNADLYVKKFLATHNVGFSVYVCRAQAAFCVIPYVKFE